MRLGTECGSYPEAGRRFGLDVAMPSVALITSQYALTSELDADREIHALRRALQDRGITCELVDWRNPDADLAATDLVVLKSPWDYAPRAAEFLSWLDRTHQRTRVLNHPAVIRWNLDKTYLGELAAHGVQACPTAFCRTPDEVREALVGAPGRVVIKPNISAASANTGLFEHDDAAALTLAEHILSLGKIVMVQPAIASVSEVGERSLIYLDGAFVHAVRKGPLLALGGELLSGDQYVETITSEQPAADELAVAGRALEVVEGMIAERGVPHADRLLYARVDVATDAGGAPLLMELELFEPSYFLDLAPGAENRFADAVVARLAP